MKSCNCITKINNALSSRFPEAKLEIGISFPDMKEKIYVPFDYQPEGAKKRKRGTLVATFCPFCGKKYETEKK